MNLNLMATLTRLKCRKIAGSNGATLSTCEGECTGLGVRASDSGSGDPGSILGRVGVLFP